MSDWFLADLFIYHKAFDIQQRMIARVSDWPEPELVCMIYSVLLPGGHKCTHKVIYLSSKVKNWS